MNILYKYVNPLVRKYLNSWTPLHMVSGAMIGFVSKHFRIIEWNYEWSQWIADHLSNQNIMVITLLIALGWERFELGFYKTKEEMYADYGGKHIWQVDTVLDVIVALLMSAMVIY